MKNISSGRFYNKLYGKKEHYPWKGQVELTYRCNLNCVHCYCKGIEEYASRCTPNTGNQELTTREWEEILDEIHKQGCLWLCFTGGEPLLRDDFLEIYSYAKKKGFVITIFTNGLLLTGKIVDYLEKSPPESIEITLNGITEPVYERITQVKGSFKRVMSVIKELTVRKLPLILKSNCLKQNKDEIVRIKAFTDKLLGKPHEMKATPISRGKGNKTWRFKYDPMIYARLNGDTTPCDYRLSPGELLESKKSDPEIWQEYERGLCGKFPDLGRDKEFLYRCNAWFTQFFINPYGRLKFCQFSEKFSVDLKKQPFREGFYNVFPQLLNEKFKTGSKCKDCSLRPICYHCPARAFLETGDEEAPVPYFCELAKATAEQMGVKLLNC
ncbi:MAG: radical SAM protein [Candidatus Omnitrophica bacterium]|nr:radical SAM protein [Candidatus Omnitrophota bacterium]